MILVTELTRWGRSARFVARSLTCFKFRFVSSPLKRCWRHRTRSVTRSDCGPSSPSGEEWLGESE